MLWAKSIEAQSPMASTIKGDEAKTRKNVAATKAPFESLQVIPTNPFPVF